jgi:uncharacterized protein YkwD
MRRTTLAALLALAVAAPADAGRFRHRHRCRVVAPTCRASTPITPPNPGGAPLPMGGRPSDSATAAPSDPAGFVCWLNDYRARSGLGPVGWDAALASDAATNSAAGYSHNFMGRARRQNVGAAGSLAAISAAWAADPPHNSALLDPTITRVGLATVNGVVTYSAY